MQLFQQLNELAVELQKKPYLHEFFSENQPEAYAQVAELIKCPFFQWTPFGKTIDDNPCQIGWLESLHRNKWLIAGNRAGKTVCASIQIMADCLGIDILTKGASKRFPPDKIKRSLRSWVVSDTEDTSIDIVQKTIVNDILGQDEAGFLWNFIDDSCSYTEQGGFKNGVLSFTNDSSIRFKFSTQKRKTFQGTSLDIVWLDEEQPKDIYDECRARVIDSRGFIMGTLTPIYERLRGIPWLYYDLYLQRHKKNVEFHNWSLLHNPYIEEEAKQELISEWDEDQREVRINGAFMPMGVTLAFPGTLLKQIREDVADPVTGQIRFNEEGKPELAVI
jgi:phage terminase large subunit-like protein